jgi:hypothetical protein
MLKTLPQTQLKHHFLILSIGEGVISFGNSVISFGNPAWMFHLLLQPLCNRPTTITLPGLDKEEGMCKQT